MSFFCHPKTGAISHGFVMIFIVHFPDFINDHRGVLNKRPFKYAVKIRRGCLPVRQADLRENCHFLESWLLHFDFAHPDTVT